VNSGLN